MRQRPNSFEETPDGDVDIYYRANADQGFLECARELFLLLHRAQEQFPNQNRHLKLDIDGHRNRNGGFDSDMMELQSKFLIEFLMPYLTEAKGPLAHLKNPGFQENSIPEVLPIFDRPPDWNS